MTPALRHRFDEGVLTVTLDRPERRNALDRATRARMAELWDAHGQRRDLRCVVLCSTGLVFCAGADTHELASVPRPAVSEGPEPSLRHLPARALGVPVIAAVQGACTGLGLDLVADADLVVASPEAWFSDPHVSLGLVSAVGQLMLSSRVAPSALRRLVLLGRHYRMGATDARACGLVDEVVAASDLQRVAAEWAAQIATASPTATRRSLEFLRSLSRLDRGDRLAEAWDRTATHWAHPDASEGGRADGQRRPPRWDVE